jgi:uncharacterized membrane protein
MKMTINHRIKNWFLIIVLALILIDLTILLNILFLRQVLGFLFLTFLPGLLILKILKLDKIKFIERIILSVGLSISFLMLFGFFVNTLSLSLNYYSPLATIPLLGTINVALIIILALIYYVNRDTTISLPNIRLEESEKAFLIMPILFPAMSIFGMHVMNIHSDNIILIILLLAIPMYVFCIFYFNQEFSKRIYPVAIISISISLLLLMALRSNHIIGSDAHMEYYYFQKTLKDQYWSISGNTPLDACLVISLLPTIYQSILNISSEFLFKILYSLIYSISPLIIYIISKKYVGNLYAFLASCFFMFQINFLWTEYNARTNIAILFFALAMMTLSIERRYILQKRILFIIFMASCMISHYSTTYIFFIIILGSFFVMGVLSKRYSFENPISLTTVILFFALIFVWYSQVTKTAFDTAFSFILTTLKSFQDFFVLESRGEIEKLILLDGIERSIPQKVEFVFTWLTFAFIGVGIIKSIIGSNDIFKNTGFLKDRFDVYYLVIALVSSSLLVVMVLLPFIAEGYGMPRLYTVCITVLSVFFVIGGATSSKILDTSLIKDLSLETIALPKKPSHKIKYFMRRSHYLSINEEKRSQVRAYLVILLVLISYFLCISGVAYQVFGVPRSILLNSEGEQYDMLYVHDVEGYTAKWMNSNINKEEQVYGDSLGGRFLLSQGGFESSFIEVKETIGNGYIFLRYVNVVQRKMLVDGYKWNNFWEYENLFVDRNKIYDNSGSEVWT